MEGADKKRIEKKVPVQKNNDESEKLEELWSQSLKTDKPAAEEKKDEERYVNKYVCPNCESYFVTDKKHGEIRCDKCGMILEEQIISSENEWRLN
ncbi:MAG: hypothetical protein CVT89_02515 [Candidatus Altiarchaeales archaeon HGW-Altiarchaeales-2]|nr:MAG: hypothetical protein CVT89_02515 [Candidatus Altiarchaeales archaeon HGW-Altiarchaeales-2]